MDIFYIAVTIFAVSIDCFFAGFSVKDKSLLFPCLACAVTFVMCLAAMYLGELLSGFLPNLKYIGCALLALVGVFNLLRKDEENVLDRNIESPWPTFALAVSVATDGTLAAFSFAFLGYVSVWIVLGLSLSHFFCSGLGVLFSKKIASSKGFNYFSGALLIVLAIFKIFS